MEPTFEKIEYHLKNGKMITFKKEDIKSEDINTIYSFIYTKKGETYMFPHGGYLYIKETYPVKEGKK